MHEVSLVADLVEVAKQHAQGRPITSITVRHATTIPDPMLRQAYAMVVNDTPLADVPLHAQPFDVVLDCAKCEFNGTLHHHDIEGHVTICPNCGDVAELEHTAELELINVETTPS